MSTNKKSTEKEFKMVSYMIKNNIMEYVSTLIDDYQQEFNITFSHNDITELIEMGEEIVDAHFPTVSYNFTLPKKELEDFDAFVKSFIDAFMGVLICAMRAHMHIAQISSRIDEVPDEAA
jgi:hypothetical protein